MNTKPLTVEEVEEAAEQFFPLFDIVRNQMPVEATIEDTLKVMETVCTLAQKLRAEKESQAQPFGFNKKLNEDGAPIIDSPEEAPPGTVAIKTNGKWAAYDF
jgi:hypothetical protein